MGLNEVSGGMKATFIDFKILVVTFDPYSFL